MNRRHFILGGGAGLGAVWHRTHMLGPDIEDLLSRSQDVAGSNGAFGNQATTIPEQFHGTARTYHVLGVPLRTGSLYPGNENDAQAYRDVQLLARMQAAGCKAVDDGDVPIPSYLPHHSIPPIRSWPGPRIAWDCVGERVLPYLKEPGQVPLLIGCDCSVVVGTTQALLRASWEKVHVLYIDGDFDDAPPDPERSQSAASLAVWFLTHASPFWTGPPLQSSQVTVVGWSNPSRSDQTGMGSISLADIRRSGPQQAARKALAAIPNSARVLLHFDVDVFQKQEMAAAYFPHPEGLTLSEGSELFGVLVKDPRIRIVEVSEYATLRDLDRHWVNKLVDLLVAGLAA
jgi:arginase